MPALSAYPALGSRPPEVYANEANVNVTPAKLDKEFVHVNVSAAPEMPVMTHADPWLAVIVPTPDTSVFPEEGANWTWSVWRLVPDVTGVIHDTEEGPGFKTMEICSGV